MEKAWIDETSGELVDMKNTYEEPQIVVKLLFKFYSKTLATIPVSRNY